MNHDVFKVQHSDGMFEATDGLRLFEQWWRPEGEPKAVVAIVHGYGEHSGRYIHVAEHLVRHGYAVDAFDLRGHGRSEGARCFIRSFDEHLVDVDSFLRRVRERVPGKPVFLLGHSMGGAIVTMFAITRQPDVRGVILSGAGLKISASVSPLMVGIVRFLGGIFPKLPTLKLDSSLISRDPEVVKRYDNDPLVHRGGVPARTGAELFQAIKHIQAQMETVTLPLLIMHGTVDALADPEGSKELYARARSSDKTLKLYEGLYHEVLNEPEKAQVLADVVQWLDAHL
jgi:alpha-beta hydrolase superfamily lysophospholipase